MLVFLLDKAIRHFKVLMKWKPYLWCFMYIGKNFYKMIVDFLSLFVDTSFHSQDIENRFTRKMYNQRHHSADWVLKLSSRFVDNFTQVRPTFSFCKLRVTRNFCQAFHRKIFQQIEGYLKYHRNSLCSVTWLVVNFANKTILDMLRITTDTDKPLKENSTEKPILADIKDISIFSWLLKYFTQMLIRKEKSLTKFRIFIHFDAMLKQTRPCQRINFLTSCVLRTSNAIVLNNRYIFYISQSWFFSGVPF